jgi:hypothetical protein
VSTEEAPPPPTVSDLGWLHRLGFAEWMAAALGELERAYAELHARHHREGLTHARRAAGMGLNALLCVEFDAGYGRSYAEHLGALAVDGRANVETRAAAQRLLDAPVRLELVTLGKASVELAEAAKLVLVWVADRLPADPV